MTETIEVVPDRIDQQQLAQQLVDAARRRASLVLAGLLVEVARCQRARRASRNDAAHALQAVAAAWMPYRPSEPESMYPFRVIARICALRGIVCRSLRGLAT